MVNPIFAMNKKHPEILSKKVSVDNPFMPEYCVSCMESIMGKYLKKQPFCSEFEEIPVNIEEVSNDELVEKFERDNCNRCVKFKNENNNSRR